MPAYQTSLALPPLALPLRRVLRWTWLTLRFAWQRAEERRALAEMVVADPRMLRDIGLSPEEVRVECRKRWWEV